MAAFVHEPKAVLLMPRFLAYGAPKIAKKMREWGDLISDKTVGNYMRKIGIKACYIKHSIKTTIQSDFNRKLRNILKQHAFFE